MWCLHLNAERCPTTTDPLYQSLIQELAARGKVVRMSSKRHRRVCSHVVILHRGKMVADDSIERLRVLMTAPALEAIFSRPAAQQDTAISRQIEDLIRA